jgi:hypothetical protein
MKKRASDRQVIINKVKRRSLVFIVIFVQGSKFWVFLERIHQLNIFKTPRTPRKIKVPPRANEPNLQYKVQPNNTPHQLSLTKKR